MNLDDLLRDTLSDDRWALAPSPDTLPAVRRKRARRLATSAVAGVVAVGTLMTGGVLVAGSFSDDRATVSFAARPTGCDVPPVGQLEGSDYVVRQASDWFMTKAQSDAFFATYNQPSPKPQDRVPSPQPSGPGTDRLVAALTAAGVPGADALDRDEADSGQRGSLTLRGTLPDGRELSVYRSTQPFPMNRDGIGFDGSEPQTTVAPVPGTACAAMTFAGVPYDPGSTGFISTVTPDGLMTTWNSPGIPLTQLRQWAHAAARWETQHPTG